MNDGTLKYGHSGAVQVAAAAENFAGASLNGLSLSCTPIEHLANDGTDTVVGSASGFFWQRDGQSYLVSNWHVISGRNSFTNDLNTSGFVPQRIRFYGLSRAIIDTTVVFNRQCWTLHFSDEMIDIFAKPPNFHDQKLDLCGVPIPPGVVFGIDQNFGGYKGAERSTCFLNEHVLPRIVTNVGADCFILGYPLRNYEGMMPPIWKRASIASETLLGVGGHPIFLVDAATTRGMSGSPILRKVTTLTATNNENGALQDFSNYELIGVYSGRLTGSDLADINIGYGWYKTMINHAINYYKCPEKIYKTLFQI